MSAVREFIYTGFYTGYLPMAPGSWGSWAAAALLAILVSYFSDYHHYICLGGSAFFFLLGLFALTELADDTISDDPPFVTVDEWAGQFLVYTLVPLTTLNLFLGFVIFRIFDTWNFWPGENARSLGGSLGIMLNDLVAGAYAALALGILNLIWGLISQL